MKKPTVYVEVKCIACGYRWKVGPGEVPADHVPTCPKCYSPGVPVRAVAMQPTKRAKKEKP